jgi:hypothetical protein
MARGEKRQQCPAAEHQALQIIDRKLTTWPAVDENKNQKQEP